MDMKNEPRKAHVLIITYPAQSHINPMLQFAKRLISKGIKATLITTVNFFETANLDQESSIAIDTISDGYDEDSYLQQTRDFGAYMKTFKLVGSESLGKLIEKYDRIGEPVTALIYDAFLGFFVLDVAKQFGRLGVVFFTQTCAVNSVYYHVQRGLIEVPLKGPDVSIPELPMLKVHEMPSFIVQKEANPALFHLLVDQFTNVVDADWVLFNTFYKLEEKV